MAKSAGWVCALIVFSGATAGCSDSASLAVDLEGDTSLTTDAALSDGAGPSPELDGGAQPVDDARGTSRDSDDSDLIDTSVDADTADGASNDARPDSDSDSDSDSADVDAVGVDGAATDECGDGRRASDEACDGDDFGGATCGTLGYASGTLSCGPGCVVATDGCEGGGAIEGDLATYLNGSGSDSFNSVLRLSDGTILVAGGSDGLDWVPAGTTIVELDAPAIDSNAVERVAFIMQLSADAQRIESVVHFPAGTVDDVFRIRTTEVPGLPTGVIYISGGRTVAATEDDGYYIARLDNNFVDGVPASVVWARDISAEPRRASGFEGVSHYKAWQPWDVGSDGRVYYGQGAEYDFDWAQIGALDASGADLVVEHWPVHWSADGEHRHVAASSVPGVLRSGIVLKAGRGGSLRSHSQADFDATMDDGNGRVRPGTWPDDVFFSGPCLDNGRSCASGPGHTGYRTSDKPTQRLGGIVIDRRTNRMFFGYSTQSRLPGGNPDFEPAIVAMDEDGALMWWSRLYEEEGVSTPDQYVDGLAVDYANDAVVVLARTHGNNVINFWDGNEVAADDDARGFQNRFTGTQGNIHISWLGKFALATGELRAATYVAEMTEGLGGSVQLFGPAEPDLEGQPNPNAGWPDLNTTRCRSDIQVGPDGAVTLMCTGRRTITTSGAFQSMPTRDEGVGTWNEFVRTYSSDLARVVYSSLLTGDWNREDGTGGGNTHLQGAALMPDGVILVGWHDADDAGDAEGNPIPVSAVPPWGETTPLGQSAIFAHFAFAR
jgi:hypothetical protein